ncbi:hypothetical protein [Clostridium sp.]|uniref:hypothetical protein n=1 Tax=Clostridium sp. TaxID=1506 RepID=UPI00283B4A98|nr:hypothetical protein [Clostridium sp.]MDR3597166.1 hypothetical protein [Clostridium sp.]
MKIKNDHFKSKLVGRGIWHCWQSVGFASTNRHNIISLYEVILIYNERIRCGECADHSNTFITNTADYVVAFLKNLELTDSEVLNLFNRWLYDYHISANVHAGMLVSELPTYDEVVEFYTNYERCDDECTK